VAIVFYLSGQSVSGIIAHVLQVEDKLMKIAWTFMLILLVFIAVACQSDPTPTATAPEAATKVVDLAAEAGAEEASAEPVEEQSTQETPPEQTVARPTEETQAEPGAGDSAEEIASFDFYGGVTAADFETTDSGLQYYILQEGEGQTAEDGQILLVNFAGYLEDGTVFANSASTGGTIPLPSGATGLIGLDEALGYLNAGSLARIIIPAELLVDDNGQPSGLPPGDVAFDMEVVEIIDGPPEAPQTIDEGDYTVTDSGLTIYDFEEGVGEAIVPGQIVDVHYTGWLEDDTIFDSSVGRNPIKVIVGAGEVIEGWDEGLQGMKLGGRRQLVIPAELGYGATGSGSIPPDSLLIFEVEVVDISDGPPEAPQVVDEGDFTATDSGLQYFDFEEGSGDEIEAGQQVSVDYTGWLEDGTLFDSSIGKQPFTLVVGAGSVIPGWDEGLQGMKLGGRRQLVIPAELAYGDAGGGPIPPNAVLIFEVEIVGVQ